MADVLYHYTCAHSVNSIRRDGKLKPNRHPLLGGLELVWLTDLDVPDVYALGLTSHLLRCRRTEYRATVDAEATIAVRWTEYARALRRAGSREVLDGIRSLETASGVLPMHWWVSVWPVPVVELEAVTR